MTGLSTPPTPASTPRLQVSSRDKVLIIGDYETGKTTLLKWLLAQVGSYGVYDPTWVMDDLPGSLVEQVPPTVRSLAPLSPSRPRVVWEPYETTQDDDETFAAYCRAMLRSWNAPAAIDEPALMMRPQNVPQDFAKLHRLGHKHGVGVWLAFHRIHGDLPALTRIFKHIFIFRISVDNDLAAIAGMAGSKAAAWAATAPDYHFWYHSRLWSGPLPPIPLPRKPVTHE